MAKDLEQMILSISADTRQIQRALKKLDTDAGAATKSIERRFDRLGKRVNSSFAGLGKGAFAGIAAAFSLREAQKLIDTATRIDNALKVAGLSGEELSKVYDALFAAAQRNAAPLEALVQLYGRASLVQKELGVSTEELLKFTDNVAVALRVSGKSAQESSGALLQLSQALGSGVVRAEEFNSMLEGALPIAQAAANGILEAGGSVAKLRKLVVDGKVSSAAFFKGFQAGSSMLKQQVSGATLTVAQGFERLQNVLVDAARRLNETTGASQVAVGALDNLALAVERVASGFGKLAEKASDSSIIQGLGQLGQAADDLWKNPSFRNLIKFLWDPSGEGKLVNMFGETPFERIAQRAIEIDNQLVMWEEQLADARNTAANTGLDLDKERVKAIEERIAALKTENALLANRTADAGKPPPLSVPKDQTPKKISLKDNPVTDAAKAKERKNALDREIEGINEDIRALDLQRRMIGATNYERDRSKALLDLTNAAQRAGIKLDTDKTAALEALAAKYAQAAEAARNARDRYEAINELTREFGQLGISAIEGLTDSTKSLNDVLADTLKWLGNLALKAALLGEGPLASLFGGKSSTGGVGGLLGLIASGLTGGGSSTIQVGNQLFPKFASGTDSAPGGPAIINEQGGEIVDLPKGARVIPHDVSMEMARSRRGGAVDARTYVSIDATGADAAGLARVQASVDRLRAELPALTVANVRNAQKRRQL